MARDIAGETKRVIREQLQVDEPQLRPEASFIEDLGADSLSLVELTLALEEECDIDITDEDAESIRTVQDAIRFIEIHAKDAGAVHRSPAS